MTNHRQYVKLIWCEKNGIAFQVFFFFNFYLFIYLFFYFHLKHKY